jgi:hypothetical protein
VCDVNPVPAEKLPACMPTSASYTSVLHLLPSHPPPRSHPNEVGHKLVADMIIHGLYIALEQLEVEGMMCLGCLHCTGITAVLILHQLPDAACLAFNFLSAHHLTTVCLPPLLPSLPLPLLITLCTQGSHRVTSPCWASSSSCRRL